MSTILIAVIRKSFKGKLPRFIVCISIMVYVNMKALSSPTGGWDSHYMRTNQALAHVTNGNTFVCYPSSITCQIRTIEADHSERSQFH